MKPCLVSCSVLQGEIEQLIQEGALNAEVIFLDKAFHVDFEVLERNLRQTLERIHDSSKRIVVVYGDLCLGQNDEMKKLIAEYSAVKVDALNCIDCILGGKGKVLEVDPNHELLILTSGQIDFFGDFKEKLKKETSPNSDTDVDEIIRRLFSGLKGIVLLSSLEDLNRNIEEIERLNTGLPILEIKLVGLDKLKQVIKEAIQKR